MSAGVATKVFIIYKPKKMLIPLTEIEIPWLYHLSSGYSNIRKANQSYI